MDGVRAFLEELQRQGVAGGHFLGLLHTLIGRRLSRVDGTLVSAGLTWRDLSNLLKLVRWDKDAVKELGIDPDVLPPRDRQRYWYSAISQAGVDTDKASEACDRLAVALRRLGYVVGPRPGS